MRVYCENDDLLIIDYFHDQECNNFNYDDNINSGCFNNYGFARQFDCGPYVNNNNGGFGPRDDIYCPWVVEESGGFVEVVGICNVESPGSYKWECQHYGYLAYIKYDDPNCENQVKFEGVDDPNCNDDSCGMQQGFINNRTHIYDCSNYNNYDESNCNYVQMEIQMDCGTGGTPMMGTTWVTDVCFEDNFDGSSTMLRCNGGSLEENEFSDSNCGNSRSSEQVVYDGYCVNDAYQYNVQCIDGNIPNGGGGDKDGIVFPVDPVFCPWFSKGGELGQATQFCIIDRNGDQFIAEYYECTNENTLTRKQWISNKAPVACDETKSHTTVDIIGIDPDTDPVRRRMAGNGTDNPTNYPTLPPSIYPTLPPSIYPTPLPTSSPTTATPTTSTPTTSTPTTANPITKNPTESPINTLDPTSNPTKNPTSKPTDSPTTKSPTISPTKSPTKSPTDSPNTIPTAPTTGGINCNWIQTNANTENEIHLGDFTTEECVARAYNNGCDIANMGFENSLDPLSQTEDAIGGCWCQYGQNTIQDDSQFYSCFFGGYNGTPYPTNTPYPTPAGVPVPDGLSFGLDSDETMYIFDCSNYMTYDVTNPPCQITHLEHADGCDINNELDINKTSNAFISDVCWSHPEMDDGGAFLTVKCTDTTVDITFGSTCENADMGQVQWTKRCDNPDFEPEKTVAIDWECIQGDIPILEYTPTTDVLCPYYFDEKDGFIQPIGSCESQGTMSQKIKCAGNTLQKWVYSTGNCEGDYDILEEEFYATQFECDGVRSECDYFSYIGKDACSTNEPISSSGEFVLGICMANSFSSFTTFCDENSLQLQFFENNNCYGIPNANESRIINLGCNQNPDMGVPYSLEGICDYTVTTTTTTEEPPLADVNITFIWKKPENGKIVRDPYARFTTDIRIYIDDPDQILFIDSNCIECFMWQIKDFSETTPTWKNISDEIYSSSIQFTNRIQYAYDDSYDESDFNNGRIIIKSTMIVEKMRNKKSGFCFDIQEVLSHILQPGNDDGYQFRIKVAFPLRDDVNTIGEELHSEHRSVTTNDLPRDGHCQVPNPKSKKPFFDLYGFTCTNWRGSAKNFQYGVINPEGIFLGFSYNIDDITDIAIFGSAEATVLIKDDLDNIQCYPVNIEFQTEEEYFAVITIDEFSNDVSDVVNSTNLGENLNIATAIVSVTVSLYESGDLDQEEVTDLNTDIIINIAATAIIFSPNPNVTDSIEAEDINNVLVAFDILTQNPDTVDYDDAAGGGAVIVAAIPDVLISIDLFVTNNANNTEDGDNDELQDKVTTMTDGTFEVLLNIEITLQIEIDVNDEEYYEKTDARNKLQQEIANFETDVVTLALSVAQPEELYVSIQIVLDINGNVANTKRRGGKKINARDYTNKGILEQPSVNIDGQGIILANGFSSTYINIEVDIAISSSDKSGFKQLDSTRRRMLPAGGKKKYKSKSGVLTCNLYESGSSRRRRLMNTNTNPNRRRLISDNKLDFNASDCFPYLISIDVQNETVVDETNNDDWSLDDVGLFPSCRYWNGEVAEWDPQGCFVYNISNVTVICACTHLTTFQISAEDFIPQANIITIYDLRDVTPENLIKYPTVWIVFISFLALFIIIGYLNPNKGNEGRSIVAYEDIIYNDIRADKMKDDYTGKQVTAYKLYTPNPDKLGHGMRVMSHENKCKMCKLQWNLFTIQLRNDHTLLSVFQRTAGTNFSTRQRLACFFMYLATIIVASAAFYGVEQPYFVGDITASFLMSLIGTAPVLIVKQLFLKSKPSVIASTAIEDLDGDGVIDGESDDESDGNNNNFFGGGDTTTVRGEKIGQLKMSKTMANALDIVEKQKMNTTIRDLNTALFKAQNNKSRAHRIAIVESVRITIYNEIYPAPRICKKIAWFILILWAVICFIVAVVYGIQFDLRYQEREDWLGNCWQNFEELVISRQLSQEQVEQIQNGLNPARSDNFPGASTRSSSWLISLVNSIILSLILWQPLTVYVTTAIKLWMFTWNISMGLGPKKIIALMTKCCACDNDNTDEKQLSDEMTKELENISGGNKNVVAHTSRPLDLIGFLGNDPLFLDRLDVNKIENKNKNENEKKKEDIELVTIKKNKINNDKEQVFSDSDEEGDGITEMINITKGGPINTQTETETEIVTETKTVTEKKRESLAVLNDIYDDVLSEEEEEEKKKENENDIIGKKEENEPIYKPSDDPNDIGKQTNNNKLTKDQISMRLDIDEMAEEYFGNDFDDDENDTTNEDETP